MSLVFRRITPAIAMLAAVLHGNFAFAAATQAAPVAATPSPLWGLMQMLLALMVVLGAIFALAWLIKRMNIGLQARPGLLKNVGTLVLGPKERVMVLEVNQDTWLIVGISAGQMTLLHSMPRPPEFASADDKPDNTSPAFAVWLQRALAARRAPSADSH
jgi:flagellar protein FliO/FliZ